MNPLEQQIAALEAELAAQRGEASHLDAQLKATDVQLASSRRELTALQGQEQAAARELAAAESKASQFDKDVARADVEIKRLLATGGVLGAVQLAAARKRLAEIKQHQGVAAAEVARKRGVVAGFPARRKVAEAKVQSAERTIVDLRRGIQVSNDRITAAVREIGEIKARMAALAAQSEKLGVLGEMPSSAFPMALLPVGIETRFTHREGRHELLVRMYPDSPHLDTHEPELTEEEAIWGKHFWEQTWRAGIGADEQDEDAHAQRKRAWAQLAQRFGLYRAAWIARVLEPTNNAQRPASPVPDDQPLPAAPAFPKPGTREESWTRAPQARLLPDRWVVMAYRGGQRVLLEVGKPIPDTLAAGPAPTATPPENLPDHRLAVDDGMRWLVDFDEAVRQGMGLRLSISENDGKQGFDTLLVLGLKNSLDAATGAAQLADLLRGQHYTDGLAFVPKGTPTNNTEDAPSGYSSTDPGFELSYRIERRDPLFSPGSESNGDSTARALGLAPDVFFHVWHADKTEQTDARSMNTALWSATWGYFPEQMMAETFPMWGIRQARRHFIDNVRAGGPLPVLRIGRHPFGLLPVTSLDLWTPRQESDIDDEVVGALRSLREFWRAGIAHVPRVGDPRNGQGDEALLHVLGMEATTVGVTARPAFDRMSFGGPQIPGAPGGLSAAADQRLVQVREMLHRHGLKWDPRLLTVAFADHEFPLSSAFVAPEAAGDGILTDPNFIKLLAEATYATIRDETYPGLPDGAPPLRSLLYLLMRHSALLEYANAAFRILLTEGQVNGWNEHLELTLVDIMGDPSSATDTVGRFVARRAPGLAVEHTKLEDVIHRLGNGDHTEAAELDDFRAALRHLERLPIARLENLQTGTLDVCSYRLDAWITSYATKRLTELRREKPDGVLIGGIGWVENLRPKPPGTPVEAPVGETDTPIGTEPDNAGFIHAPSMDQAATAAILRSGYLSDKAGKASTERSQPFAVDLSSRRVRLVLNLLDGIREGQALGALLGYRFERGLHERGLDHYIHPFRILATLGEIYKARAALSAAEQQVALLDKQPHPALAAANAALATARANHHQLLAELSTLPTQLQEKRARVANLDAQIKKSEVEVQRLMKLVPRLGVLGPSSQQLKEARAQLESLKHQRGRAAQGVDSLTGRQKEIAGQVTAASARVTDAQREIARLRAAGNPGLAAALEAEEKARANYERLLEEQRRAVLLPPETNEGAMESIAARNVVDGLALHKRFKAGVEKAPPVWDHDSIPFGDPSLKLPQVNTDDFRQVVAELEALDDALDAVGDAITAEQVYQTVKGNMLRAGVTLDSVIRDEAELPELEVVRTPRSGLGITHRLLVLLSGEPAMTEGWSVADHHIRAAAEPRLSSWAARLLGDPTKIRASAEYLDPTSGKTVATRTVTLRDLDLSPLDVVYLAQDSNGSERTELEQRLLFHLARTRPSEIPNGAGLRLSFDAVADGVSTEMGFAEMLEVARALRELVTGARAADARDLSPPDFTVHSAVDVQELKARADAVETAFKASRKALDSLMKTSGDVTIEALRTELAKLALFGIQGAFPVSTHGETTEDRESLLEQAASIAAELGSIAEKVELAARVFDRGSADLGAQAAYDLERMHAMLGVGFRVLPCFKPANPTGTQVTFDESEALQAGDPLHALTWFRRIARVREGAARLSTVLTYDEALHPDTPNPLAVAQVPHIKGERWVGLPPEQGKRLPGGTTSIVAHLPDGFDASRPLSGLVVDDWQEVVPSETESTGIAFHYDRPNAFPPQAILLAVPPDGREKWDFEVLEQIALETLDLLKLRAVDPDALKHVEDIGHFLPALFVSLNLGGDTVSTDFRRAVEPRSTPKN